MFVVCINMHFLPLNNNISFKSTPLHHVNVLNAKTGELIPAIFSKLNPKDNIDIDAITEIQRKWYDKLVKDIFCPSFIEDSRNMADEFPSSYFCIEKEGNLPLYERILGLAETKTANSKCYLRVMATKDDLQVENGERQIKGVGKVLLGSIINQTKRARASLLDIISSNDLFYYKVLQDEMKIKIEQKKQDLIVKKKYFDKCIDYFKKQFNIDFSRGFGV